MFGLWCLLRFDNLTEMVDANPPPRNTQKLSSCRAGTKLLYVLSSNSENEARKQHSPSTEFNTQLPCRPHNRAERICVNGVQRSMMVRYWLQTSMPAERQPNCCCILALAWQLHICMSACCYGGVSAKMTLAIAVGCMSSYPAGGLALLPDSKSTLPHKQIIIPLLTFYAIAQKAPAVDSACLQWPAKNCCTLPGGPVLSEINDTGTDIAVSVIMPQM